MSTPVVRTRFAPSPSGHLHVGGARTALFNWAYARKRGGKFILRIEDTDVKRSSDSASMGFLADLKWLGILWDEGPEFEGCGGPANDIPDVGSYFQSQRLHIYDRYIEQLIEAGYAYRAFDTAEELDAARKRASSEGREYRYDRDRALANPNARSPVSANLPAHVVRFKIPDVREVIVNDEVRGEVRMPREKLDDFVIRKQDGYPTYHFAVVVDDELMGVTHVIRAEEHLSNTPKHVLLQDALGFRRPVYAHISIITNPDGSKMSKRDKDKALRKVVLERSIDAHLDALSGERRKWWLSNKDHQLELEEAEVLATLLGVDLPEINVDDFRRAGYLPEALNNYLALLGWNPGENVEKFDRDFLVERFDFDRVIKGAAKFDRQKLLAFNNDAIAALPPHEFVSRLREHGRSFHPVFVEALGEKFDLFARANQSRSKTLEDPFRSCGFLLQADESIEIEDSKAVRKVMLKGEPPGYDLLETVVPILEAVNEWSVEAVHAALESFVKDHAGGQLGRIAQPLRIAVSGGVVSPGIAETLAILGRDSTLARIRRCLSQRTALASAD
jgi:glutamyl-tRNA synthetase